MPDHLLDNREPPATPGRDPDVDANAAGEPEPVTTVSINRSTVAELERRSILRLQASALLILAAGAVLSLIYIAKLVLIVVLVSVLISFVLAPVVDFLDRFQIPRGLASFIAVFLLVCLVGGATYISYSRAMSFMHELPMYKARIQSMVGQIREQAHQIEQTTETVLPATEEDRKAVTIKQSSSWTDMLSRNASSVTEIVLALTFIPFLVFFMLSWQDHVRSSSVMLFSMENRNTAYVMLGLVAGMIRSFIVGNFIIGVFLSLCSMAIFGLIGLPYFYFLGVISGFLSLIPYLGLMMAIIPPLIADLGHLTTATSLVIVGAVLGLHLVAMNVLYPKILGKRLQLNPLAVTLALLFWGWLWGAMGLILAVPITGALKIICDNIERLRPYGAWMGE
ncbi:MAG: AI-2E family transporter [Acidobacteriota bacterium]|nr:AI-2E family transporter [Acidobacteriota bacterium]